MVVTLATAPTVLAGVLVAGTVLLTLWMAYAAAAAIGNRERRAAMVAAGVVAALPLLVWFFGVDVVPLGVRFVAGYLAYGAFVMLGGDDLSSWKSQAVFGALYWLVNTAVLGRLIGRARVLRTTRADGRRLATGVTSCLLALVASGCLSATPPKTPNQRAVERDAPRVVVPPPPDAGRTPRPAAE